MNQICRICTNEISTEKEFYVTVMLKKDTGFCARLICRQSPESYEKAFYHRDCYNNIVEDKV